jgi:hypothetical protein
VIDKHLGELLSACQRLTRRQRLFMLLTCHAPAFGPTQLAALLTDTVVHCGSRGVDARLLTIPARDGRLLPSGVVARWPGP